MAHREFKAIHASNNKGINDIGPKLLTSWVEHETISDEQVLHDYDNDSSTYSTSSLPHASDSWTSDDSTAIQSVAEQSGSFFPLV